MKEKSPTFYEYLRFINDHPEYFIGNVKGTSLQIITDIKEILKVEQLLSMPIGIMYEDQYIYLLRDAVKSPDGTYGTYIRTVQKNAESAVAILPILGNKIALLSQFRHAVRQISFEIPRGMGIPGKFHGRKSQINGRSRKEKDLCDDRSQNFRKRDLSAINASKESQEELGVSPLSLRILGRIAPDTGFQTTVLTAYAAYLPVNAKLICKDKHEAITDIRTFTTDEINVMIKNNKIFDGITLAAFMLAKSKGIIS